MARKKVNFKWKEVQQNIDFEPWCKDDEWRDIDFFKRDPLDKVSKISEIHYQILTARRKRSMRDVFTVAVRLDYGEYSDYGYYIRDKETEEIIAVIKKVGSRTWAFMLKYDEMKRGQCEDGWARERLTANTVNTVFERVIRALEKVALQK